jgi:hypothetical protein
MAAANFVELLPSTLIDSDTTTLGSTKSIPHTATEIIITSEVIARTDGTFTVTVQHSPDGTNWFTLGAAAAQSANGMVIALVTQNCFHNVRASVASTSTTDGASVKVRLYHSFRTR